jgi:formate dehydrogenase iron-sulfur subunit
LAPETARAEGERDDYPAATKGVLVDLTRCIGCGWCQEACKEQNELVPEGLDSWDAEQGSMVLSADTWTVVTLKEVERDDQLQRVFVKRQCMHCVHPACVSACPVSALEKLESGAVVYHAERCIGCRYCMIACPFGVPKFEWDEPIPQVRKCTFCIERQVEGLDPACVASCPTEALLFGDRSALITEAETRILENPDLYVHDVYGREEVGGTTWMYLSPLPFQDLGFPILASEPVTELNDMMAAFGTPSVGVGVAILLGGLSYRFSRLRKDHGTSSEE